MDQFPRIELFSRRERRAAAVFALVALALLAGALAYVRPAAARSPAAAAPTPRPPQLFVYVTTVSANEAFISVFDSASMGARTIFHTADGGHAWQRLKVPADVVPLFITPLAARGDLALSGLGPGRNPEQWVTHDGGAHWTPLDTPRGESVQFVPDSSRAFSQRIGPEGFTLRVSDDEGATWRTLIDAAEGDPRLAGVSVRPGVGLGYSSGALWLMVGPLGQNPAAQTPPHLLRSTDEGASWQEVTLPPLPADYSAHGGGTFSMPVLTSGGRGYMAIFPNPAGQRWVGRSPVGYVTTTEDGGATWSPVGNVGHFPIFPLLADSSWWATDGQDLFESADFGASWGTIHPVLPHGLQLMQITRATTQVAWNVYGSFQGGLVSAEPDRTHLLKTTDGGRHWTEVAFPAP